MPNRIARAALATLIVSSSVIPFPGLTNPASAATLIVNSTGDASDVTPGDGICDTGSTNSESNTECTLRAAIEKANTLAGTDSVAFSIRITEAGYRASPLSYTLSPTSSLPGINETLILDATTQPYYPSTPIIVLDGSGAGVTSGLKLMASNTVVRGLVINSWGGDGIEIISDGNTIPRNYVGTDVLGTTELPNAVQVIRTVDVLAPFESRSDSGLRRNNDRRRHCGAIEAAG
jgi:hypothetical protein